MNPRWSSLALVDDAARLADQRAFDRIGHADAHCGAHASQRLDAFLQVMPDLRRVRGDVRGQQLAQHLHLVQQPVARDHELVLAAQLFTRPQRAGRSSRLSYLDRITKWSCWGAIL